MGWNKLRRRMYEVSSSLRTEILSGGGGSSLTTTQEEKLAAISGSIIRGISFPLNAGTRPSSRNTTSTWNNDYGAVRFDHDGTPTTGEDGYWLMNINPQLEGRHSGSDVVVRCTYSLTGSGYVDSKVRFGIGNKFLSSGDALGSYTYLYENIDIENVSSDVLESFDITISGSTWDDNADILMINLTRQQSDAADNYPGAVYIHRIEFRYPAYGFKPVTTEPSE